MDVMVTALLGGLWTTVAGRDRGPAGRWLLTAVAVMAGAGSAMVVYDNVGGVEPLVRLALPGSTHSAPTHRVSPCLTVGLGAALTVINSRNVATLPALGSGLRWSSGPQKDSWVTPPPVRRVPTG
jgi:hypothetical protein